MKTLMVLLALVATTACATGPTHRARWVEGPVPLTPLTMPEDFGQERTGQVPVPSHKPLRELEL